MLDEDDEIRDDGFEKLDDGFKKHGPTKLFRRQFFYEYDELNKELEAANRANMAQAKDEADIFREEAVEILTWEGIDLRLKENSKSWPRLVRTLQEASIEAAQVISKRNEGEVIETPEDPLSAAKPSLIEPVLSALVEQWFAEKKLSNNWRHKAEMDYRHWIDAFLAVCGDKPFTKYEKSDARDFKNYLLKLPTNIRGAEERDPFSDEQLAHLFASPLFVGCKSSRLRTQVGDTNMAHTAFYWLPIMSLFTGARLNELCQLRTSDVLEGEGVTYLNISYEGENQRTKTNASKRRCPVHSKLLHLGFRDFSLWREQSGEGMLFEEVKLGVDGYFR